MMKNTHIQHFWQRGWGLTIGALLSAYFAAQAFQGEHSIPNLKELNEQERFLQELHASTALKREKLEARVAAFRADNLDPDMLEEQARDKLGYAHPDEIIIFLDSLAS